MSGDITEGSSTTEDLVAEALSESSSGPTSATSVPTRGEASATTVTKSASETSIENTSANYAVAKEGPSRAGEEKVVSAVTTSASQLSEAPRMDVSAVTVARMMGIASTSDLRVLEGRIDLLSSRVAAILTKMDRCLSMFGSVPTASDIGRLEVQVASVKSMMKELLDSVGAPVSGSKEQADREGALEQSRKLRQGIKTNTES